MDKLVYGSSHMAALHFDQGLRLLGVLFDSMTEKYALADDETIHLSITPQKVMLGCQR